MNERIKELAEQAERLAKDELAHLERVHNRLYSFTEGREIYNQKFAVLIVRECIVDFYRNCLDITSNEDIAVQVERYVQEHFGVEE